jgi:SAM-dependent methyltransferase/cytidylate kinase
MAQYQTFPGVPGESPSVDKLRLLRLPELGEKSFLDVGCNEGFFCGFAKFENAACVVGVDRCSSSIQKARKRFSGCEFLEQNWEELPAGPFDVILLASSLHYAKDQEGLIHSLMERLTVDGILVLELGIGPKGRGEWVEVKSGIDKRLFPTWAKLEDILEPYAWKNFGPSVCKKGHPERYIVHVRRRKAMAYLLRQLPDDVECRMSMYLFKTIGVQVVADHPSLFASLIGALVKLYFQQGKQDDFAVEGSVLTRDWAKLSDYVAKQGYLPIEFTSSVGNMPAAHSGRRLAYLLMQPPGYGKTSISKRLFKRAGIKVVSGDEIISAVAKGCVLASSELTEAIRLKFTPMTINQATHHVLNSGLTESLVKLYLEQAGEQDFALDAYVPAQYHNRFSELIAGRGYTPITLNWLPVGPAPSSAQQMLQRANAYSTHLEMTHETPKNVSPQLSLPFKGTQGFVEHVKVEHGSDITLRGWALHETGEMPSVFRLMLRQREIPIISFTKYNRPDVQQHFKLDHALCGYVVTTRTKDETKLSHLPDQLQVFGGMIPDMLDGPFRYSKSIKEGNKTSQQQ